MRAALLPFLCLAALAAASWLPSAAAADPPYPVGVAQPAFNFSQQGSVASTGDPSRLQSWAQAPFEAQLQTDAALGAPTLNDINHAVDFHIEDAPSLLKIVQTATPNEPAVNYAAPFTLFVALSMPASSSCMPQGTNTNLVPPRPCAIVTGGDLSQMGDFVFAINQGKLSASLNTSATGALVVAASDTALAADTLTVARVHYDKATLELKLLGGTPFPAAGAFDPSLNITTTSATWIGGPPLAAAAPAPGSPPPAFGFFEGEIMEVAYWPTTLDATDDTAIFQYLHDKWTQPAVAHTPVYPGTLHAPDWILNASTTSGVTLNADGRVSSWDDTAGAYRTAVGQGAPTVAFNAQAAAAPSGPPGFDARLPAVVFGSGGLTVSPTSAVQWNRASLFFVLRVPSTSSCLQTPTSLNAGCLIWSSTSTGFTNIGDIALTISRDQRLSAGVMLGENQPAKVTMADPITPDVALVVHLLIDETAGVLLLTDGVKEARLEISVSIAQQTAAQTMLLGLSAPAGTSTLSAFDGGMLMELQAWIPSVESPTATAILTRQERLDTIEALKAKWAPTNSIPAMPLADSSSGAAAASTGGDSSSGGDSGGDFSSSGASEPSSDSSSGSVGPEPPTTVPASARAVLRFLSRLGGIDCSQEADRAQIKSELSTALGIAQTFVAINSSTAPPDNRIAIDLFSTGSSGAPALTQSALRALWRRLLAIGGDPTDPALQIAQLETWRTSDTAPWKTDAASYPSLAQLDPASPISVRSTAEAPITTEPSPKKPYEDNTAAVISSVVLITFVILLVISCLAVRLIWKKNAEAARARSTANRSGGAFGPEDPERELGERESHATDASGSRGLRRAAADGALRSPSYLHHQSSAHENSLREPSGIGGGDGRMREVSLREARKNGGAGGSPLARGSRDDDDDGADAEEAAVWASLSPESQAAHGRAPPLRLQSIELQPKEGESRRSKAGGSAAERAAAARAAARAGSKPAAASHVIASDFPVGADEEEEEEDRFAAQGATHTNTNQRTKAFPVRLHE